MIRFYAPEDAGKSRPRISRNARITAEEKGELDVRNEAV